MQKIFKTSSFTYSLFLVILSSLFFSCRYDLRDLSPTPDASFTVEPVAGQVNRYVLRSTSTNAFRFDWDKGTGVYAQGKEVDTAYFPDMGNYTVRLFVFGHSGIDSAQAIVNVAADDPAAQTPLKLLTGNSTKTWKLAAEPGALWIGPDPGTTWWANNAADVTTRSCLFNDEYTFTLAGNVFNFDSKGDFYVDEEGGAAWPAGMPPVGCYPLNQIPAAFQAWSNNGTFTFEVINNSKLKVTGMGAHLGLYKTGTPPNAAVTTPQASVTYDIESITATRMVLKLDYGWGIWKFIFTAA